MKVNKLFLAGALALGLGFTACTDNDPAEDALTEGNTHVSVSLKLAMAPGTRALPSDYNEVGKWAGRDVIQSVVIYVVGEEVNKGAYDIDDFTINYGTDASATTLTPINAIKTTAGKKKIYALINGTTEITTKLNSAIAANFDAEYKAALTLDNTGVATSGVKTSAEKLVVLTSDKEAIVMTNTPQTPNGVFETIELDVKPNISADDAKSVTSPNRASLFVERSVARAMVTQQKETTETYEVKNADQKKTIGVVSDVKWVLAQGENSLYIQQKTDYVTPAYDYVPKTDADYWIGVTASQYDYSGLYEGYAAAPGFGGTTVPALSAYTKLNAGNQAAVLASLNLDANAVNGKFILPTTHEYDAAGAYYKKGNTAYVLVRAKFTPVAFADNLPYTPGDDFWLGENGKFYTKGANALDAATGGVPNQKAARYVGGKVLYYAWLNPDVNPDWYNSPVIRNNVYHIHINGFKNIGTNWNPLFPEDPDTPNPKNPDPKPEKPVGPGEPEEPKNPIDPKEPLTNKDTWMSVDVTVIPWTVHSYDVDLGI